jgi:glycosyltransferase involved in cell wall biosynthesis
MDAMTEPLVSILIPAYNAEKYIKATIRSALDQTWRKKEIIIVDDGSVDGTLQEARRFSSRKVRIESQANAGAAAARNKAYQLCNGDFVQWLDADDLLHPDKIALQMQAFAVRPNRRILLSSAWGYFYHRYYKAQFYPSALWCDLSPAEWMMRQMEQNLHMQTATWLVSRELTEAAGPWDPRMLVDDDGEYFCRVMRISEGIAFIPGSKTYYRRSGATGVSYIGRSGKKQDAQLLSMRLHIDCLRALEDSDRSRAACVQYIQNWLVHFYPARMDIVKQLGQMAKDLGGELSVPQLSWKYRYIEKAFGWNCASHAKLILPRIKENLISACDKALYRISPKLTPQSICQKSQELKIGRLS